MSGWAYRCERGLVQALSEGHRSVELRYRVLLSAVAAVPLALVVGCAGSGNPGSPNSAALSPGPGGGIPPAPASAPETLTETGSTLLFPLMGAWASAYHRQYPNVSITTAGTGSGKGISDASAGTVSIGASDAYLSSGDLVKNPTTVRSDAAGTDGQGSSRGSAPTAAAVSRSRAT